MKLVKYIFGRSEDQRLKRQAYNEINRAKDHNLEATMTSQQWVDVMKHFNHQCPITGTTEHLSLEHFIPVSWGHSGTTIGNCYPLESHMNMRKSDRNPFVWMKTEKGLDIEKWNNLISYLATQNGMPVHEFVDYVNWCFKNQRDQYQIQLDGSKTSKELYQNSLKQGEQK